MRPHDAEEGLLRKQKLNAHTCAVLAVLGFGSLTYGYTASIIGTTLGMSFPSFPPGSPSRKKNMTRLIDDPISILQGQPSFIEYFDLATRSNGTDLISTMNGLFQTGGVIGTLLLPTVADRYGRKWACAVVSYKPLSSAFCAD